MTGPRRGRAPRGLLAVALVLAAGLTGCAASIPTSGPIEQGQLVGVDAEDQFIRVIARPPRPGMTAAELVQGFLEASASFDGNHAVAREYLTASAAASWDPSAAVRIYDNPGLRLDEPGAGRVNARGTLSGTIDREGRVEVAAPGTDLSASFVLVRSDGEWRIAGPPAGLLLSRSDVERAFRTYDVYFFDPTFSILVPDPRTIPVIGPGLATSLVRRLLTGPTAWLAPAVRTAIPAGTGLSLDAVPLDGGVARVDLTSSALAADDTTRRAMSAQLVWTLRQLPDVSAVEITVGGQPYSVPGVPYPQPQDAWPSVDPNGLATTATAVGIADGAVVRLGAEGVRPVPGAAGRPGAGMVEVAQGMDGVQLATLDGVGGLWTGSAEEDGTLTRRFTGADLARPSFDREGTVWTVDRGAGVRAVRQDGSVARVPVSGLPTGSTVLAVALARDGTRAALVVRTGTRTGLLLARVERRGSSLRLATPVRVESRLTDVLDVAWQDADSVAVLGSDGAGPTQVFAVDVAGGSVRAAGAPAKPRSLAAAPDQPLLVGAADGRIYQASATLWRSRAIASAPAFPG